MISVFFSFFYTFKGEVRASASKYARAVTSLTAWLAATASQQLHIAIVTERWRRPEGVDAARASAE